MAASSAVKSGRPGSRAIWTISIGWWAKCGPGDEIALDFAINCFAGSSLCEEHPVGFLHRPDGKPSSTLKTPQKKTRRRSPQFLQSDWKNLWKEMKGCPSVHGSATGLRISGSTIPHPKPNAVWNVRSLRFQAGISRCHFPCGSFHASKMMKALAKRRVQLSPTPISPGAIEMGTDRVLTEAYANGDEYFFAGISSQNSRIYCRSICKNRRTASF